MRVLAPVEGGVRRTTKVPGLNPIGRRREWVLPNFFVARKRWVRRARG
jgi:hypothetical protein